MSNGNADPSYSPIYKMFSGPGMSIAASTDNLLGAFGVQTNLSGNRTNTAGKAQARADAEKKKIDDDAAAKKAADAAQSGAVTTAVNQQESDLLRQNKMKGLYTGMGATTLTSGTPLGVGGFGGKTLLGM